MYIRRNIPHSLNIFSVASSNFPLTGPRPDTHQLGQHFYATISSTSHIRYYKQTSPLDSTSETTFRPQSVFMHCFRFLQQSAARLTFQSLLVTSLTTRFNIKKFCTLITLRLCVLYGIRSNSNFCLIHH
jgi:hypothetical protein